MKTNKIIDFLYKPFQWAQDGKTDRQQNIRWLTITISTYLLLYGVFALISYIW